MENTKIVTRGSLIRQEDKDGWRWYVNEEGVKYISVTKVLEVATHERLVQWWQKKSGPSQKKTLEKAGRIGTEIHRAIEDKEKGKVVSISDDAKKAVQNWDEWSKEHFKTLISEQHVYSDAYGFAGTLDLFGIYQNKHVIADIKSGRYSIKTGWQLAAYRQAFLEQNKYTSDEVGMLGIQVHRDGSEVKPFLYEHHDFCLRMFLCCLEIFKGMYFRKLEALEWHWLKQPALEIR